jgi:hypothetical protein
MKEERRTGGDWPWWISDGHKKKNDLLENQITERYS